MTLPIEAGVIYQGNLWGAVGTITAAEQTAHRRDGLVEPLGGGLLELEEIVERLWRGGWARERPSVAVVRAYLRWLVAAGKVRRMGSGWRWGPVNSCGGGGGIGILSIDSGEWTWMVWF